MLQSIFIYTQTTFICTQTYNVGMHQYWWPFDIHCTPLLYTTSYDTIFFNIFLLVFQISQNIEISLCISHSESLWDYLPDPLDQKLG